METSAAAGSAPRVGCTSAALLFRAGGRAPTAGPRLLLRRSEHFISNPSPPSSPKSPSLQEGSGLQPLAGGLPGTPKAALSSPPTNSGRSLTHPGQTQRGGRGEGSRKRSDPLGVFEKDHADRPPNPIPPPSVAAHALQTAREKPPLRSGRPPGTRGSRRLGAAPLAPRGSRNGEGGGELAGEGRRAPEARPAAPRTRRLALVDS